MAMQIRWYDADRIAQYGRSRATLDATGVLYCPSGCHGHRFRHKKSSSGVVKSLFEASVQKAQNVPSNQLIKSTSCVERSNATIKAEELS